MDEVIERIKAAKDSLAIADVFDDLLTDEIVAGWIGEH